MIEIDFKSKVKSIKRIPAIRYRDRTCDYYYHSKLHKVQEVIVGQKSVIGTKLYKVNKNPYKKSIAKVSPVRHTPILQRLLPFALPKTLKRKSSCSSHKLLSANIQLATTVLLPKYICSYVQLYRQSSFFENMDCPKKRHQGFNTRRIITTIT